MAIRLDRITLEQFETVLGWVHEPEQVFGERVDMRTVYRLLMKMAHPDSVASDEKERATRVAARINDLYHLAGEYIAQDSYGCHRAATVVTIKEQTFRLLHVFSSGELCDTWTLPNGHLMSIPHDCTTNDLMMGEVTALEAIKSITPSALHLLFPEIIAYPLSKTPTGTKRLNVLRLPISDTPDNLLTVRQLADYYHHKIDPRQIAWIWRKMLMALDMAHEARVVHGNINPDTVILEPHDHTLCITGWQFSTMNRAALKVASANPESFYPPEINVGDKTTYGLDTYMGAKTMLWAGAARMPPTMKHYFNYVSNASTLGRPQNVREMLHEFDGVIYALFGPRSFTPMTDLYWPLQSEESE